MDHIHRNEEEEAAMVDAMPNNIGKLTQFMLAVREETIGEEGRGGDKPWPAPIEEKRECHHKITALEIVKEISSMLNTGAKKVVWDWND